MAFKNSFRYLLSLTPGIMVIAGNLLGGYWTLANAIYTMVLLIGVEQLFRENKNAPAIENGTIPNIVLAMHMLLHTASIATLLYGIESGVLTGRFIWLASLSTGISSGIEGINSAHEMIHRKQAYFRLAGIWNLLLVNYSHFYVEHIRGHHKNVGTSRDAATAHYGESFYRFFVRTVPAQYLSALNIEADRLKKNSKHPFGLQNLIVQLTLIQVALSAAVLIFLGWYALLAYLHQSVIAFFLLEYVNYIEHYGLSRTEGTRVNATHSWQSDMPVSRFALIELSRHADHHVIASKPFYKLASLDDSPVLPTGYFGSFYLALVPSLWFKKVNPVLEAYKMKTENLTREQVQTS